MLEKRIYKEDKITIIAYSVIGPKNNQYTT